jgi:hypothetical protein
VRALCPTLEHHGQELKSLVQERLHQAAMHVSDTELGQRQRDGRASESMEGQPPRLGWPMRHDDSSMSTTVGFSQASLPMISGSMAHGGLIQMACSLRQSSASPSKAKAAGSKSLDA